MTSIMSVSRIPVPARDFDVATRHQLFSAKTRLERLRDEFQRRLLFEKHAKMHKFYTQKQSRDTKAAASRRFGSGDTEYDRYINPEVAADFSERERLGIPHKTEFTSPTHFSGVPGSSRRRHPLPHYPKRSAGRDRAHLLAPINPARPNRESPKFREGQANESRSLGPSPDDRGTTYTLRKPNLEMAEQKLLPRPPQVMSRPKIVRPYVRNRAYHDDLGKGQLFGPKLERLKQEKLRQLNIEASTGPNRSLRNPGERIMPSSGTADAAGEPDEMENPLKQLRRMSDFQNWQTEQNKERARLLQRLNEKSRTQEGSSVDEENLSVDDPSEPWKERNRPRMNDDSEDDKEQNQVWRQKQQILQRHNRKEAAKEMKLDDEEEDFEDEKLKQKEQELQELILRQEEELQKLRQGKFEEEEEENLEATESEKQRAKFRQQKQTILEPEMSRQKGRQDPKTPSETFDRTPEMTSSQKAPENKPTRRTSITSLPPKQTWKPQIDPSNEETAFYLQKAISEGNLGAGEVKLVPCQVCGRSFAYDRLAKHEKICSKESKKTRKVFDHVAMRYRGTDFENHIKRRESTAEEPVDEKLQKSHWRTKHQNLIDTMKYAKKVSKVESEGGNLSHLPPPPVTLNPDYIQCPHCQRRFNQKAADRHIPWCKDSKSRQPLKPKGHRQ